MSWSDYGSRLGPRRGTFDSGWRGVLGGYWSCEEGVTPCSVTLSREVPPLALRNLKPASSDRPCG